MTAQPTTPAKLTKAGHRILESEGLLTDLLGLEAAIRSEVEQDREEGYDAAASLRERRADEVAQAVALIEALLAKIHEADHLWTEEQCTALDSSGELYRRVLAAAEPMRSYDSYGDPKDAAGLARLESEKEKRAKLPETPSLIKRLRASTRGLGSEDPYAYMARGVSAGDCLEAVREIETLRAQVAALPDAAIQDSGDALDEILDAPAVVEDGADDAASRWASKNHPDAGGEARWNLMAAFKAGRSSVAAALAYRGDEGVRERMRAALAAWDKYDPRATTRKIVNEANEMAEAIREALASQPSPIGGKEGK